MSRSRILASLFLVAALGVTFLPAPTAQADTKAAASASATDFVKGKHKSLVDILKGPAAERDQKVMKELASLIDYDEMAKAALGTHWDKRTDAERKEFKELLRKLVEKSYRKSLDQTLDYEVSFKKESPQGSDVLVQTEAKSLKDKHAVPVGIDYLVRKRDGGYIVVDLVPEGSSWVKVYNKEANKVIGKDGWDGLIKKMKDRLAKP